MKVDLNKSWNIALVEMHIGGTKWNKVKGPISITIAAIARAGWCPARPHFWYDKDRARSVNLDGLKCVKPHVKRALQEDLCEKAWCDAAQHYMGSGLEKGSPDLGPAK